MSACASTHTIPIKYVKELCWKDKNLKRKINAYQFLVDWRLKQVQFQLRCNGHLRESAWSCLFLILVKYFWRYFRTHFQLLGSCGHWFLDQKQNLLILVPASILMSWMVWQVKFSIHIHLILAGVHDVLEGKALSLDLSRKNKRITIIISTTPSVDRVAIKL